MAANPLTTLRRMFGHLTGIGQSPDGKRDYYDIYGYPLRLDFQYYYWMHRRNDIAKRITQGVPRSCWRDKVEIKVDDKEILKDEMVKLVKLGMFKKAERADVLNRIGKFSVLYIGIPDNLDPKDPVGRSNPASIDNVYFHPYAYDGIVIKTWDMNPESPRCGLPETYQLQVMNRGDKEKDINTKSFVVHHSRVVHMAEDALDSDVEGIPALENVVNRFIDMNKTVGGSAEAYFRNADGKYSLETDPEFASTLTTDDKKELDEQTDNFINQMQSFMRLNGIQAKALNTPHADPKETVLASLKLISGATGIPIRILTGEGAGQTTGSEDKATYNAMIKERQDLVCTDWLNQILQILSNANIIGDMPDNSEIIWPVNESLNEKDKSESNKNNATALKTVAEALNPITGIQVKDPSKLIKDITGFDADVDDSGDDGLSDEELQDIK